MLDLPLDLCKESLTYTPCYCEENIYLLAKAILPRIEEESEASVVFISNPRKLIPLWSQQKQHSPGLPVLWDYHVILVLRTRSQSWVYDFDTTLDFPCPLDVYIAEAFRPEVMLPEEFRRKLRVLSAREYGRIFASNRSHMVKDGEYISPPPSYPPIRTTGCAMNLYSFIDMSGDNEFGRVYSEDEIAAILS
ncbi:uncharacterized protein VTP21DRAFT_141 [Calcarisporiella thermophila]|uniref:uncharacterized protein n=1 Tax=Calcarisporiella thermophila TaxID=911321 RepID=UPI003743CD83